MSLHRTRIWLVAFAVVLCGAAQSRAQHYEAIAPFDYDAVHDDQPFAPADLSTYGGPPPRNEGFFFSYQRLLWSMSTPEKTPIGSPTTRLIITDPNGNFVEPVQNSEDTGFFRAEANWGNRFEGGYVVDNCGWMIGGFEGLSQRQNNTLSPAIVLFEDPANLFGNNIPRFDPFIVDNYLNFSGVEIMHINRCNYGCDSAHQVDYMFGVQYYHLKDLFRVQGSALGLVADPFLNQFFLNQDAIDHVVGPKIGARYVHQCGRFIWDVQGGFTAGVNYRTIQQKGNFTTGVLNFVASDFKNELNDTRFSPSGDFRLEFAYQLTKAFALKVGYDAVWIGGVARAADTVDYEVPRPNIQKPHYGDNFFANGVSFGFEFNR